MVHGVRVAGICGLLKPLAGFAVGCGVVDGLGIAIATGAVGCAVGWTATCGVSGAFSLTVGVAIFAGLGVTAAVGAGRSNCDWDAT